MESKVANDHPSHDEMKETHAHILGSNSQGEEWGKKMVVVALAVVSCIGFCCGTMYQNYFWHSKSLKQYEAHMSALLNERVTEMDERFGLWQERLSAGEHCNLEDFTPFEVSESYAILKQEVNDLKIASNSQSSSIKQMKKDILRGFGDIENIDERLTLIREALTNLPPNSDKQDHPFITEDFFQAEKSKLLGKIVEVSETKSGAELQNWNSVQNSVEKIARKVEQVQAKTSGLSEDRVKLGMLDDEIRQIRRRLDAEAVPTRHPTSGLEEKSSGNQKQISELRNYVDQLVQTSHKSVLARLDTYWKKFRVLENKVNESDDLREVLENLKEDVEDKLDHIEDELESAAQDIGELFDEKQVLWRHELELFNIKKFMYV